MPIAGLDHVAITVQDVPTTVEWYERVLGARALHLDAWRAGRIPVVLLQVGGSRLSVHDAASPAGPHAAAPTPGSADICFRFTGAIEEATAMITDAGVVIVEGPVPRPAADGTRGTSIYCRDPDANLIELLSTD
jgi:catechol 2,3-dioxygenase-like lactoylglutathione lyase family enzyme